MVYDPELPATVNLASNIAGTHGCIIAGPDNLRGVLKATGLPVLYDLRRMDFRTPGDVFRWYLEHIFPLQRHDVLGIAPPLRRGFDIYRDYLIEFNIPTFWIPGKGDADFDPEVREGLEYIMSSTGVNIPVLGFYPAGDGTGLSEFEGVKWAGRYGKFTLVNSYAGGYSYHSGVKVSCSGFQQERPASRTMVYDPSKKYVAMIMVESGRNRPLFSSDDALGGLRTSSSAFTRILVSTSNHNLLLLTLPSLGLYVNLLHQTTICVSFS